MALTEHNDLVLHLYQLKLHNYINRCWTNNNAYIPGRADSSNCAQSMIKISEKTSTSRRLYGTLH